jgi:hypothetical protein
MWVWTMRKSRYDEAEGGEFKLDACEVFFRYRVHVLCFCFCVFRICFLFVLGKENLGWVKIVG